MFENGKSKETSPQVLNALPQFPISFIKLAPENAKDSDQYCMAIDPESRLYESLNCNAVAVLGICLVDSKKLTHTH